MRIDGLDTVIAALQKKADAAAKDKVSVAVGYSAAYALYLDQDRQAHHANGQAGFLSDTAKEMAGQLGETVKNGLAQGLSMEQSLLLAGLELQAESQKRCPVDTGACRSSAYTRKIED